MIGRAMRIQKRKVIKRREATPLIVPVPPTAPLPHGSDLRPTLFANCLCCHTTISKCKTALAVRLAQYIVYGNQVEAEKIISAYPSLLLRKVITIDYSGRIIEGTPLQLALGAEDVKYHADEKCMVEIILQHFEKLPNAKKYISQQIGEHFSENYTEIENIREEGDSIALGKIFSAIANANENDKCKQALSKFVAHIKPQGLITNKRHFNFKLYEEALELYIKHFEQFGGWNSHKNNLVWRKVLGNIARLFPANYAQVYCQGTYEVFKRGKNLKRSLVFNDKCVFFPLDSSPSLRLGSFDALRAGAVGHSVCGGIDAAKCELRVVQEIRHIKKMNMQRICEQAYEDSLRLKKS
jgi:hypothetical protein